MLYMILNKALNEKLKLNVKTPFTNVSIPSTTSKQCIDIYLRSLGRTIYRCSFYLMLLPKLFSMNTKLSKYIAAGIYLFKIHIENTRTMFELVSNFNK